MSMGGGGSSKPPVDIMTIKPDTTVGVLPPDDGKIKGIQRRVAGQTDETPLLVQSQGPKPLGSIIG